MLYWVTGTINSSHAPLLRDAQAARSSASADGRIEVPTGCAIFPKELYQRRRAPGPSACTTSRTGRASRRGGHFAAMERPAALADDLRKFFRTVR